MIKLIDLYGGNDFNPGQIKANGYSGVIFKAGQGAWADVPRYHPDWWRDAKAVGLLVGWYWLCDSRYHSSAHIDEMVKFKILDDLGELGLWIDVEKPVISMSESTYWATKYAGHTNLIDFAYLLTLRGIKPGIYTGPGAYNLVMRDAPKTGHDFLAQFDLWTAQYPYNYVEGVSRPDLYGSWKSWTLWQWREGPDINIFNGTDEEFYSHFSSVKPPIGEESMIKATVNINGLNFRDAPISGAKTLPALIIGDRVEGDSISADNWMHVTKVNGADRVGYIAAWYLKDIIKTEVIDPIDTSHVVEVFINGVSVYRKELM